jgi:protein O-GlcNAc transferase
MNLQHALTHHRAGRLAEAQAIYRQILAVQPNHADALHLLGLVAVAEGRREQAVELLGQAVDLAPNMAGFHFDFAEALAEIGQVEPAIASYRRSLALRHAWRPRFYVCALAAVGGMRRGLSASPGATT